MKYGLVLSGGGARGFVHLGIIKALEEMGLSFSCIAGTSAGSIVGAFYAYGFPPDEIARIVASTSFLKTLRMAWSWTGLLDLTGLGSIMLNYMPENNFSALKIPTTIAATDLMKGRPAYFTEGELIPAILASCCIPGIFKPVEHNGSLYVDGGILDNMPVKAIRDQCDFVIAAHCNPIDDMFDKRNLKAIVERSLLMAINGNTSASKTICDLLIEPPEVGKFSGNELARGQQMIDIGYTYTMKNFTPEHFAIKK